MKRSFLSIVIALMMLMTSIVPFGTFAVMAEETANEPLDSLLANGAIKIVDFSNLTEDTLMNNIGKVSEGHTLSVNTDSAFTLNGAATSLRWDMPVNATSTSYFEMFSDYELSKFDGCEYTVYVKFYAHLPEELGSNTFRFEKRIGAQKTSGGVGYGTAGGMGLKAGGNGVNGWRSDYGLSCGTNADIAKIEVTDDTKLYTRLQGSNGTVSYPIYIDGVWLVLNNYNKTNLAAPTSTVENEAMVDVDEFNANPVYSLSFAKDILADSSAVTVLKNGEDVSASVGVGVSGANINLTFADGITSGDYTVTVNKSNVRAKTGETLSADVSYTFTAVSEKEAKIAEINQTLFETGRFKIADFSNLTEETLMNNIVTVEGNNTVAVDDYYVYEEDGAATSLKWTLDEAANGIMIKSDYDLSYLPDAFNVYVAFYAPSPEIAPEKNEFRFQRGVGFSETFSASLFTGMSGFGFTSTNLDGWRKDLLIASSADLLKKTHSEDSDIYVYLRNDSYATPKKTYPIYIDSIWIGLPDYGTNLSYTYPTKGGVWELKDPSASNNYVMTFDKLIAASEDAVTVLKDGVDVTSECTISTEYYSLYVTFPNGLSQDSNYTVKVNKNGLKGTLGSTLKSNYEDNFVVRTPSVADAMDGKITLAEFGNGDISAAQAYSTDFAFELNEDANYVSEGKTSSLKITLPSEDNEKAMYINPQVAPQIWPAGAKLKFRFYNAGAPATETTEAVAGDSKINIVAHKVGGEANWKPYWIKEVTLPYGEWTEFSFDADAVLKTASLNGNPLKFRINHGGWNIAEGDFVPGANIYLDSVWLEFSSYGAELAAPVPATVGNGHNWDVADLNAQNEYVLSFASDLYNYKDAVEVYNGDSLVENYEVLADGSDLKVKFDSLNEGTYKVVVKKDGIISNTGALLASDSEFTFNAVNGWSDGKLMLADFGNGDATNLTGGTWPAALSDEVTYEGSTSALKATFDATGNKYVMINFSNQRSAMPDDSNIVIRIYNSGEANNSVIPVFCTLNGESGWKPYKEKIVELTPGWNDVVIPKSFITISEASDIYLRLNFGGWSNKNFTNGDSVYVDSIWAESDSFVFDEMIVADDYLSASALISADNKDAYADGAIIAAVYDNATTLSYAKIAKVVNGEISVSIDSLNAGQTVKYMFIENITSVKPAQESVSYTAQ